MCARTAVVHRRGHARRRRRALATQGEERRPGARQAAAERAGVHGRALDHGQARARAARAAARRWCPRASGRSARSRPCAGRRRTRPGSPTAGPHRRAAPCRRAAPAPSPFRSRGRDARRPRSGRPEPAAGSRRADSARRTSTKPPQMHGAMLSACADPAPSRSPSSAQAISVSTDACAPSSASTATTAAAALAALPPSPLDSGSPLRMRQRHAAPLAERRQQRQRRRRPPCSAPPRAAGGRRRPGCSRCARRTSAKRGGHFVAGRFEREPEHVEAARDVRHGRRRKGGDGLVMRRSICRSSG